MFLDKMRQLLKDFYQDLFNKKLLVYKIVYFLIIFGVVIFYLQLTVHQRSLGLSLRQTGYISSINFVLQITFPFLTSIIADKIGNFKFFLIGITAIESVVIFLFSIIPPVLTETECFKLINSTSSIHNENASLLQINCNQLINDSNSRTFGFYVAVNMLFTILNGASITIYDAGVLLVSEKLPMDYGKQKAWGTAGAFVSALLGGVLVDIYSIDKLKPDYSLVFYVSSGITLLVSIIMSFINIEFKVSTKHLTKKILKSLSSPEVIILLFIVFFRGIFSGYIDTFVYRYISNLGASGTLIGLTITVAAPLEFIFNLFATNIINTIGFKWIISVSMFCYSIRFLGIGFLTPSTVELILLLEVFDGLCYGLFLTSVFMYSSRLVSMSLLVTLRGLIGATNDGLGKMVGALAGNEINNHFEGAWAWRMMAIFPAVVSVGYFIAASFINKYKVEQTVEQDNNNPVVKKKQELDNPAFIQD